MKNKSRTKTKNKHTIIIVEISPGVFRATTLTSKYIIEYDRNKCIGASSCAAIAPLTFLMDDENKATINRKGNLDSDDIILKGAISCPVFAIKIYEKSEDTDNTLINLKALPENIKLVYPISE